MQPTIYIHTLVKRKKPLQNVCVDTVSAYQYSFWNAVTFGAAKFQVDIKGGGGVGMI